MAANPKVLPQPGDTPLTYEEAPPGASLRHAIACYWQIAGHTGAGPGQLHRILPDACVDVIFDLQVWRLRATPDAAQLVGTMTRAACFTVSGSIDLLGIRFRPGGAAVFCQDPLQQLTDASAPADTWLNAATRPLLRRLADTISLRERVRLLEGFLLREFRAHPLDAKVLAATRLIDGAAGHEPAVAMVARTLGLGERQLERRFQAATGLAPVVYRRVRRFRRVLDLLGNTNGSLVEVAAAAGYFDQAHMTREFNRFAGLSPRVWRAEQADVAFVQDARVTLR